MHFVVSQIVRLFHAQPSNRARLSRSLQLATDINKSRPVTRKHPLVSRRTKRIDLHSLNIDRKHARGLARVDDQRVTSLYARELFEIRTKAVRELHVAHRDNSGARIRHRDRKSTRLNSSHV